MTTTQSQVGEVQKARHRKDIKERRLWLLWLGVPAAAVVALLLIFLVR